LGLYDCEWEAQPPARSNKINSHFFIVINAGPIYSILT
jgi:hypothetical protein